MSPEETNIACCERLGWTWWTSGSFTDLLPGKPANPLWRQTGRPADLSDKLHIPLRTMPDFYHSETQSIRQLVSKAREWGWNWFADEIKERTNRVRVYFKKEGDANVGAFALTLSAAICAAFLQLSPPSETP